MEEQAIAKKLKQLRDQKKLSLRGVASKIGISASYLSSVEKGQNQITVAKLKLILSALDTTLGAFFSDSEESIQKVVYHPKELVQLSTDPKISLLEVAAGKIGRSMQMVREVYRPGADTGLELYSHESEDVGIVLKGEIELMIEDEIYILKAGDSYYMDNRRPHRIKNKGKVICELITCNSPPTF